MVPHYNYYPPAGSVIDSNNSRASWNGRSWIVNGKHYKVPSSHHLVGAQNGALHGWYYDWKKHAWMEPSAPTPSPAPPAPIARPAPKPAPQPQPAAPLACHKEASSMERKPNTVLEDLAKHPVAPVLGGMLVLAGYVTDEPSPPTIPDGLPDAVAQQWQMIYAQNMQRYARRMDLYRDLGMVLLGYSGTRSLVDVLGGMERRALLTEKKSA